jgi:hypothetical protein
VPKETRNIDKKATVFIRQFTGYAIRTTGGKNGIYKHSSAILNLQQPCIASRYF